MGLLDDIIPDVVNDVLELLTDQKATYLRRPKVEYDLKTGEEYPEPQASYSITMAPPFPYSIKQIEGQSTQRRELVTYISKTEISFEPDPATDTIMYSGVTYRVHEIDPIVGGDVPGVWTIVLRN